MNKLQIDLRTLTDKDFNPELVADLITDVLKSVGINVVTLEFTKVAETVQLRRRTPRKSK